MIYLVWYDDRREVKNDGALSTGPARWTVKSLWLDGPDDVAWPASVRDRRHRGSPLRIVSPINLSNNQFFQLILINLLVSLRNSIVDMSIIRSSRKCWWEENKNVCRAILIRSNLNTSETGIWKRTLIVMKVGGRSRCVHQSAQKCQDAGQGQHPS